MQTLGRLGEHSISVGNHYAKYKITNERGKKIAFIYAHVKWFYGQSERAYYLNYFIKLYKKNIVPKIGFDKLKPL